MLPAVSMGLLVGNFLLNTGRNRKAIELLKECLVLLNDQVVIRGELWYLGLYARLAHACQNDGDPRQAIKYGEKALAISIDIGDGRGEGVCYTNLGNMYQSLGEYVKAREFLEKAIAISIKIGDRNQEGSLYCNLGKVYESIGEYVRAREFLEKALAISKKIGVRRGEVTCYANLGEVYEALGEYVQARTFLHKALEISIEIGDRCAAVACYGNLGRVCEYLGEFVKARNCIEKALAISIEIGNRRGEGAGYCNLGNVYQSLGDYVQAKQYHEKALAISKEIGDRRGEGVCYNNLGKVFNYLGEYLNAIEFHAKALAICIEIGDRHGEGANYGNLGGVYQSHGEYVKAREFNEKALAISIEIGCRKDEGTYSGNLGTAYQSLGEFAKAKEFYTKALAISKDIGDRHGEGACYGSLGTVCQSPGEFAKTRQFLEKALAISTEIGDRHEEGICYGNLGTVYHSLGEYEKAREFLEKALAISKEIGDKEEEGECYGNLGTVYSFLGLNKLGEEYYMKGLAIAIELGTVDSECYLHYHLARLYVSMMRMKEARASLFAAVVRLEDLRGFIGEHDKYKINFADENSFPYELLTSLLCSKQEIIEALLVSELARARALADLMSAKYSLKGLANRLALVDIEQTMRNEKTTCTGLYISLVTDRIYFWIIKTNKKVFFQGINSEVLATIPNCHGSSLQDYVESLANQSYRNLTVLLEGECEDRSLFSFYASEAKCQAQAKEERASCRLAEELEQEQEQEPALRSMYRLIISPVMDLLEDSEIIICPPPPLYQVPFSALMDEDERYLSEKFRIRLIPSLTTLKQIQDSPADYHTQIGALIVGDPNVGRTDFSPLPCAREEAEMIGRLLHVQPLIGPEATKQAVLQSMRSVSLIHIAAHGDAKRGEIALAPLRPMNRTAQKEDFMLTMADVSEVQLRAKLVVLSCCHSGRGEIRNEGVIGIARAFLGSGARSVLVSLWAVDDRATKEFMREFYEHLSRGENASECLHEAMKWMRGHPEYCAVRQWAPFVLIGDNVTFNFEELTRDQRSNST